MLFFLFVYNAKIRTFSDMAKYLTYFNILNISIVSRETSVKHRHRKPPSSGAAERRGGGGTAAAPPTRGEERGGTDGSTQTTPHTTNTTPATPHTPHHRRRPPPICQTTKSHVRTPSHSPPLRPQGREVADDQLKSRSPGTLSQKERKQGTPPSPIERQTATATRPKAQKHGERRGTPHKQLRP